MKQQEKDKNEILFQKVFKFIKVNESLRPSVKKDILKLITEGADPTVTLPTFQVQNFALLWAVMNSDEEAITLLLPRLPGKLKNINRQEEKGGNTVITSLIFQAGKPENQGRAYLTMLEKLINAGADPTLANYAGFTPLIKAAVQLNSEICLFLLRKYSSVRDSIDFATDQGMTALTAAVISLCNTKDVLVRKRGLAIISACIEAKSNVSYLTNTGNSALYYAALSADVEVVRLLLRTSTYQQSINNQNNIKLSPLQAAVGKCARDVEKKDMTTRNRYKETIRLLLAAGADPKLANKGGYTPLIEAVLNGADDLAESLLEHKEASEFIALSTENGHSGLTCASDTGNIKMLKKLLEKYKEFDIEPILSLKDGTHLLIIAVRSFIQHHILSNSERSHAIGTFENYYDCIEYLAAHFEELLNRPDKKDCTAFYYICRAVGNLKKGEKEKYRHLAMMGALLKEKGASISSVALSSYTPVRRLKEAGANMDVFLKAGEEGRKAMSVRRRAFLSSQPLPAPAPPAAAAAVGSIPVTPPKPKNWAHLLRAPQDEKISSVLLPAIGAAASAPEPVSSKPGNWADLFRKPHAGNPASTPRSKKPNSAPSP